MPLQTDCSPYTPRVLHQSKSQCLSRGLLASGLLVEKRWGGIGRGQCCGHVHIQVLLFQAPWVPDLLGVVLSAASFNKPHFVELTRLPC